MRNKLKNIVLILTIMIGSMQSSCWIFNEAPKAAPDTHEQQGFIKATIINYKLDGCSWMLQLEGDKKLQPMNLSDEFKKENLKVWIHYQPVKQGNSICMAGQMVTITAIEVRK